MYSRSQFWCESGLCWTTRGNCAIMQRYFAYCKVFRKALMHTCYYTAKRSVRMLYLLFIGKMYDNILIINILYLHGKYSTKLNIYRYI